MYQCRVVDEAAIRFRADFSKADFAFVSLFDRQRRDVLFHVSLRQKTGLIVCNRRTGPVWGNEVSRSWSFAPGASQVELRLVAPGTVVVLLNGVEAVRHESMFPGLDRVVGLDCNAAVDIRHLTVVGGPEAGPSGFGDLSLGPAMRLAGWALDPAATDAAPSVQVIGTDLRLSAFANRNPDIARLLQADGDMIGFAAQFPGRVWLTPEGTLADAVVLQAMRGDLPCGAALEISRPAMLARIEQFCTAQEQGPVDAAAVLTAIEHVRFGAFHDALSPSARRFIARAADFYRLGSFLYAHDCASAADEGMNLVAAEVAPAPAVPQDLLAAQIVDAFVTARRKDPADDPMRLLSSLLRAPYPPDMRTRVYLMLAEEFCLIGRIRELHARIAAEGIEIPAARGDVWHDSRILPFLLIRGRSEELLDILSRIEDVPAGSLSAPAVAWVVRETVGEEFYSISFSLREQALLAFIRLIDRMTTDYWGQAHNAAFVQVTAALVSNRSRISDATYREVRAFALRAYGLNRRFWQMLDAQPPTAGHRSDPEIAAAGRAFRRIMDCQGRDDGGAEAALSLFQRLNCPDAARFRREIFGPAEVAAPGGGHLVDRWIAEGCDPRETALRLLAFPGDETGSAELAILAREAVADRYDQVPKSPFHSHQIAVSRRLLAFLGRITASPDPEDAGLGAEMDAILLDMTVLTRPRSRHVGLRLAIGLMIVLLRRRQTALAAQTLGFIGSAMAALSQDERANAARSPSVVNALGRVWRISSGDRVRDSLAAALRDVFSQSTPLTPSLPATAAPGQVPDGDGAILFDTLVVIVSCDAHLATKAPEIRAGWVTLLADMGIPWVFAVGGGTGTLEGDVLRLDAPDDYEGLPQKVLAAVRWVRDNTPFGFMFKVDDDCLLNVEELFHSHSHTKFDYYGRRLAREAGQIDRAWHIRKSTTPRGRLELDKSPEPSVYAEGGSGYSLSRRAMDQLLARAATPEGRQLIDSSFMEDKLVGDLLAGGDIWVEEQDYMAAILRRTGSDRIAVSVWGNSFLPSLACGVKTVHLDGGTTQAAALCGLSQPNLTPRKIWPSYAPLRLGYESHGLELISPPARLAAVAALPLVVVGGIRNEMTLLPQYLAHYRALGAGGFLMADNLSDDGSLEYLAAQDDVAVFSVDTSYSAAQSGGAWRQALLSQFRVGAWSLVASADEFLVCDPARRLRLPDVLADPAVAGADALRVYQLDMYPQGPLAGADLATGDPFAKAGWADRKPHLVNVPGFGRFSEQPVRSSALRHRLMPHAEPGWFPAQRLALLRYRPWMRLSPLLDAISGAQMAERALIFAHFRYHAGLPARALAEIRRRQYPRESAEYRAFLTLPVAERSILYDPELSVPWQDCELVRDVFG